MCVLLSNRTYFGYHCSSVFVCGLLKVCYYCRPLTTSELLGSVSFLQRRILRSARSLMARNDRARCSTCTHSQQWQREGDQLMKVQRKTEYLGQLSNCALSLCRPPLPFDSRHRCWLRKWVCDCAVVCLQHTDSLHQLQCPWAHRHTHLRHTLLLSSHFAAIARQKVTLCSTVWPMVESGGRKQSPLVAPFLPCLLASTVLEQWLGRIEGSSAQQVNDHGRMDGPL